MQYNSISISFLVHFKVKIHKQFNGKTSYKINEKETTYQKDLKSTNESNNKTDNTSDSNEDSSDSFEELANPVNNNESLISELNDQLKYLKEDNKNKTEIIKVLAEITDKHLLSHEEFVTTSNRKKRNSFETRNDSLRSPNRFQILASANTDNCDKLITNENVNNQSSNNTFQGQPPQILETLHPQKQQMNHLQT